MKLLLAGCLSLGVLVGGATAAHAAPVDVQVNDAEADYVAVSVLGSAESDVLAVTVFGDASGEVASVAVFGNACSGEILISVTGEATGDC